MITFLLWCILFVMCWPLANTQDRSYFNNGTLLKI